MAWMAGINSRPSPVSAYSTDGGVVGITLRTTTAFVCSSRSRVLRTLAEMGSMSARSSMNRRGPALKCQITFGVQAPPKSDMHSVNGQAGNGGGALFLRTFSGKGGSPGYQADTGKRQLPEDMGFPSVTAIPSLSAGRPAGRPARYRPAEDTTMQGAYVEVADVLSTYFDALYHSDTARLRRVFHPRAQYVCATEETLIYQTMDEYFPIVGQRPSPASREESRADSIVSIEFAGPVTAFARVHCAIGHKFFTDLLTLICVDGRWQIISKVFHFDIREA